MCTVFTIAPQKARLCPLLHNGDRSEFHIAMSLIVTENSIVNGLTFHVPQYAALIPRRNGKSSRPSMSTGSRERSLRHKHLLTCPTPAIVFGNATKPSPKKNPLHYQDPRGSAKTIFLDSLSACKDMQLQVPDFGEGTCCSWLKL